MENARSSRECVTTPSFGCQPCSRKSSRITTTGQAGDWGSRSRSTALEPARSVHPKVSDSCACHSTKVARNIGQLGADCHCTAPSAMTASLPRIPSQDLEHQFFPRCCSLWCHMHRDKMYNCKQSLGVLVPQPGSDGALVNGPDCRCTHWRPRWLMSPVVSALSLSPRHALGLPNLQHPLVPVLLVRDQCLAEGLQGTCPQTLEVCFGPDAGEYPRQSRAPGARHFPRHFCVEALDRCFVEGNAPEHRLLLQQGLRRRCGLQQLGRCLRGTGPLTA